MVHRKGSRKAHRKAHRKSHRRGRTARRTIRAQHGGASCSAQPAFNGSPFAQRGGMAPINAADDYLIDAASRVQAQTAPLDTAFGDLQHVIPRQAGGRRRRSAHRKGRRSSHRRGSRKQKGGALAGYHDPSMLRMSPPQPELNPQWLEHYPPKGAQAA
jgi:hypothetical protein